MTPRCMVCGLAAAVSTPYGWVCKRCHRDAEEMNKTEFPIANAESCPVDGAVLNGRGECSECWARAERRFVEAKVRVA